MQRKIQKTGRLIRALVRLLLCGNDPSLGKEPCPTVHGALKARILKWYAIPFSVDHILSELCIMTIRLGWPYTALLIVSLS